MENALAAEVAALILKTEGYAEDAQVSFVFTGDAEITRLNRKFRRIDKTTDVLSFPLIKDFEGLNKTESRLELGDVVINMEAAERQAAEYGHSLRREVAFLAAHGMFHLLGYDHVNETDEAKMTAKQEKILKLLRITRD